MRRLFLLFQLLCLTCAVSAQEEDHTACFVKDPDGRTRDHNVDFKEMRLEVSFIPEDGLVIGNVQYKVTPIQKIVDTLYFDAVKINIKSARHNGRAIEFKNTQSGVTVFFDPPISWDTDHKVEFDYEASPRKGIYFIGWNDPQNISRKQIWTQGQGTDNRHWIPSYDFQNDKLITETIVHFGRQYEVISNGNLVGVEDRHDGNLTWHYRMTNPHASYLVMLAIGQYDYKELEGKNGVKIRQYFYPDLPHTFEHTYRYSVEMMDWCEEEFGVPYPWETYANVPVQDFIYGAMENTTATIFTDFYVQDERAALERNYVGTNAHELVHQWFGDYITAWSGHDHWLHESFATHYAKHFRRFVEGEDAFQWIRKREMESSWRANKKNQLPVVHSKAGSARHYPKGSLVIDMLRYVVGKEQYDRALTYFLTTYAYKSVDTRDFQKAFMETLGMNLDWFFDQWLYRGGEPHYEVAHRVEKDRTIFYVDQTHEVNDLVGYFQMPITFEVYYEGSSKSREKHWVYGPSDTITIPNPDAKTVEFVLFDPNNEILKTIEYTSKATDEWISQALQAENMIDRHFALLELRSVDNKEKRDALIEVYNSEQFYANRSEVVRQLVNDTHSRSVALIAGALSDDHAYVRRAAIEHVDEIHKKHREGFEAMLNDPSYVNVEKALRLLCDQYPDSRQEYLETTSNEVGMDHNIRTTWLELSGQDDMKRHLSELVAYSSQSYGFRTRINALNALQNLNYCDQQVLGHIVDGMLCTNRRLVGPAKKALKFYRSAEEHQALIDEFYESREWEEWELDIVKYVFEASKTEPN